jgi:hypothetical protein
MKTRVYKNIATGIFVIVLAIAPPAAFAADMWAETPDLNDESNSASATSDAVTFRYESPTVDMWAEVPDLNAVNENHGVLIDTSSRVVNNFNPKMYAETPGLNDTTPGSQPETMESILLSKEK